MTSSPGAGRFRPGPIYDSALRALLLADPLVWYGWSGEPIDAAVLAPVAGDLPAGTRFAGSVAPAPGAGRLVHVEVTRGAPSSRCCAAGSATAPVSTTSPPG